MTKNPASIVLGFLLALPLALTVGAAPAAAQSGRVALLPFKGVAAVEIEAQIVEGIPPSYLLIPIKQVDYVVGRSGRPPRTIGDYVNVARRLKATALIE